MSLESIEVVPPEDGRISPGPPRKGLRFWDFQVSRGLSLLGGALVGFAMLLITADVIGRYVLNRPIRGSLEVSQIVLCIIVFSSVSYFELQSGHIRITMVTDRLSAGLRDWFDVLAKVIGAVYVGLLAWQALDGAIESWRLGQVPYEGGIGVPLAIPKFAIFLGCSLLGLHWTGSFLAKLGAKLGRKAVAA